MQIPAKCHALRQFETWIVFLTLWSLFVNEWLGPSFLVLILLFWVVYCVQHAGTIVKLLIPLGILPWLLPFLALVSTLWSPAPDVSARGAIQFGLTVALALLTAQMVAPRRFIVSLWIVTGILLVLSVAFNKPYFDAMTGRTTMGGVFGNKNTLSFCSMSFAIASAAIFSDRTIRMPFRMTCFFGIGLGMVLCVLARSVGGIAAMMLALGTMFLIGLINLLPRRFRTDGAEIVFLAFVVFGVPVVLFAIGFREDLLALAGKDATLTGRTLLWFYADRLQHDHPIFGVGYQAFWLKGSAAAEFLWKKMHIEARSGFHFHSIYYETIIQLGYVGVTLGLLVLGRGFFAAISWARQDPGPYSSFSFACILALLALQWQAIGLFTQFDLNCYLFMTSFGYAVSWCRQAARLRQRQMPAAYGGLPAIKGHPGMA